jgi:hypothetical protein
LPVTAAYPEIALLADAADGSHSRPVEEPSTASTGDIPVEARKLVLGQAVEAVRVMITDAGRRMLTG